jgi:putative membrane protein
MEEKEQSSGAITVELAKKRNRDAAERTLMAWIRTSLSLISFGFGIDRIVNALKAPLSVQNPIRLSRILGLSFIALGVFALFMAIIQHRAELKRIRRVVYTYTPNISLSVIVATGLIAIGLAAFIGIILSY